MGTKVYEIITDRIIEKLEQGTIPWHKPWSGGGMPKNAVSGKEYRGVNVFMLHMQGFGSPYWLTFKQVKDLKGYVKAGSKSTPIVYWNWIKVHDDENDDDKQIPFLRYYNVFNVEQCTDLKFTSEDGTTRPFNPITDCEKIVHGMPNAPEITHNESQAYYRPSTDVVNMPKSNLFEKEQEYYSTLFHELVHSTGHTSRLDRHKDQANHNFGSQDYSKEELIAEMGASFLCGVAGIDNMTIDNSAAYIASWLKKLKDDKQMVIYAAAKAQKAADYILDKKASE